MSRYVIHNNQIVDTEERKDARKYLASKTNLPVVASCKTLNSEFEGSIQDISSSGIFIITDTPLSIGHEIALTFKFPDSQNTFAATGNIIRVSNLGVAIEVKVIFNKEWPNLAIHNCQSKIGSRFFSSAPLGFAFINHKKP